VSAQRPDQRPGALRPQPRVVHALAGSQKAPSLWAAKIVLLKACLHDYD
jgi:hypothetical protein